MSTVINLYLGEEDMKLWKNVVTLAQGIVFLMLGFLTYWFCQLIIFVLQLVQR